MAPDVSGFGVVLDGACGVGFDEGDGDAAVGGEVVVFEEVGFHDFGAGPVEEGGVFGPFAEVGEVLGVAIGLFAGVAGEAVFGEDDFAAVDGFLGFGEVGLAAGDFFEGDGLSGADEVFGEVVHLVDGGLPEDGFFEGFFDIELVGGFESEERVVAFEPLLAVGADVDEDAAEGAGDADGVRAIDEDVGDGALGGFGGEEECTAIDGLVFGDAEALGGVEDAVDDVRVVVVVGGDDGGVDGAGVDGVHDLFEEVVFGEVEAEDFSVFEVLVADGAGEIFVGGIFRIEWWISRVWGDVADGAGHADAVGADEGGIGAVGDIGVEFFGVPAGFGFFVELGVGEEAEAEDAGGVAVDFGVDAVGW